MKKTYVLVSVLAILLASCAPTVATTAPTAPAVATTAPVVVATATKAPKDIKVGISFGTVEQELRLIEKNNLVQAAQDLGMQTIFQSAENDETKQTTQCENMIAQGIDVLVLFPLNSETSAAIVKEAHAAGVPVIDYVNPIYNSDQELYAGHDLTEAGRQYAKFLVDRVPKGNYLILNGDPSWYVATQQKNGIHEVIDPYVARGDIKIVAEYDVTGFATDLAMSDTEAALTANNNKIDAILSIYDGMSQGAIAALAEQGMAGKVPITGQDAELAACQRIVEGTQSMSLYKPTGDLAKDVMNAALLLAQGRKNEIKTTGVANFGGSDIPEIPAPLVVVTKDNMCETIIKAGFHTLDEVYENIPKDQWPTCP
jgi:D-xylose transport system substrate-binding protein